MYVAQILVATTADLLHHACSTEPMFDADINAGNPGVYNGIGLFHEALSSIYKIRWMLWFCFMEPCMGYCGMKLLGAFLDFGFPTFVLGLPDQGASNWMCWPACVTVWHSMHCVECVLLLACFSNCLRDYCCPASQV